MALACSSLTRRTQAAMVLAYAATLFLTLGSVMVYGAQAMLDDEPEPHRPTLAVLTLNPFFAAADATGQLSFDGSVTSPLEPLRGLLAEVDRNHGGFGNPVPVPGGGFVEGPGFIGPGGGFVQPPMRSPPPVATTGPPPPAAEEPAVSGPDGSVRAAPTPEGFVSVAPVPDGFVSVAPVAPGGFVSVAPMFPDGQDPIDEADDGVPFWLWSALALGTVAVAAFFLAAHRLRTPSTRAA